MLQTEKHLEVRFCEVDSMNIVWHGHYVKYLEDGREDFGRQYGLSYLALAEQGWGIPIVELEVNYKQSLRYGDAIVVETTYVPQSAPKICFAYRIRHAGSGQLVCTGRTTQVFIDTQHQLQLTAPAYFTAWQQQWLPSTLPVV